MVRGAAAAPVLESRVDYPQVLVRLTRPRQCRQDITRVDEIRAKLVAEVKTGDGDLDGLGDPRGAVIVIAVAVPVIVTSALVTGIAVAVDQPDVTRRATDADGRAAFTIPDDEPRRGAVKVRAGDAPPQVLPYVRLPSHLGGDHVRAGLATVQEELVACAVDHGLDGAIGFQVAVDPSGVLASIRATSGGPVLSGALSDCAAEVAAGVRFPPSRGGARGVVTLRVPPRGGGPAIIEG